MAPRKRLTANTVAEAPRSGLEGRSRRRKRGCTGLFPRQARDRLFETPRSARLLRMRSAGFGAILKVAALGVMAQLLLRLKAFALIALLAGMAGGWMLTNWRDNQLRTKKLKVNRK